MATFTNYATLSYTGGTTDSNTVTGELLEVLSAAKTAVQDSYATDGRVTYVISLVNSGTTPFTGLTLTDTLGGYAFDGGTVYPLAYRADSLRYYQNGGLQAAPTVTAGPPLVMSGITVPAGGSALLVYEASVTDYAPQGAEAGITNTVTVTGGGLSTALTAQSTVSAEARAVLSISKALCPSTVTENGQLSYTFVIENGGSVAAAAGDSVVLTDTFDPKLSAVTVTYNGTSWTEGTEYTYQADTGLFTTTAGQITVPAATHTQTATGTWHTTPGTATVIVRGTV